MRAFVGNIVVLVFLFAFCPFDLSIVLSLQRHARAFCGLHLIVFVYCMYSTLLFTCLFCF